MERGYGSSGDVQRIEENGVAAGALADAVSEKAKTRQRQEMGTLGSGNPRDVTGDITAEYLARLQEQRSDQAKALRRHPRKGSLKAERAV